MSIDTYPMKMVGLGGTLLENHKWQWMENTKVGLKPTVSQRVRLSFIGLEIHSFDTSHFPQGHRLCFVPLFT